MDEVRLEKGMLGKEYGNQNQNRRSRDYRLVYQEDQRWFEMMRECDVNVWKQGWML